MVVGFLGASQIELERKASFNSPGSARNEVHSTRIGAGME